MVQWYNGTIRIFEKKTPMDSALLPFFSMLSGFEGLLHTLKSFPIQADDRMIFMQNTV